MWGTNLLIAAALQKPSGETTRICDGVQRRTDKTPTFHPLMRLQTLAQPAIFAKQSKQPTKDQNLQP